MNGNDITIHGYPAMNITRYRYRLLGCPHCGRTWIVDNETTPKHHPRCEVKVWAEVHTFFADDRDGPGFPLTQTVLGH